MSLTVVLIVSALWTGNTELRRSPPLMNPVLLNMGFVCKWQETCIKRQQRAMTHSLRYLETHSTPSWKIRVCNRNASRGGTRKDWVGFKNCIRNPGIRGPSGKRR